MSIKTPNIPIILCCRFPVYLVGFLSMPASPHDDKMPLLIKKTRKKSLEVRCFQIFVINLR